MRLRMWIIWASGILAGGCFGLAGTAYTKHDDVAFAVQCLVYAAINLAIALAVIVAPRRN